MPHGVVGSRHNCRKLRGERHAGTFASKTMWGDDGIDLLCGWLREDLISLGGELDAAGCAISLVMLW